MGVGRGYKGKGVLIHLLVDCRGNPVAATTTPANGDERKELFKLLDLAKVEAHTSELCRRPMIILEADKGYDASWLRQGLLKRGIFPFIPRRRVGTPNPNRPTQKEVGEFFKVSSVRWVVERAFAWLKRKFRRLMLRWERLPRAWMAVINLSIIRYWIRILVR